MKPTVTLLLSEFDELRKRAEAGEKLEAMKSDLVGHWIFPNPPHPMTPISELENYRAYLKINDHDLRKLVERWFA